MEKIRLVSTDSTEVEEFYVLDQAKLGGKTYILVADEEEGDGMAMILRDDAEPGAEEALYAIVDDDNELNALLYYYEEIM